MMKKKENLVWNLGRSTLSYRKSKRYFIYFDSILPYFGGRLNG